MTMTTAAPIGQILKQMPLLQSVPSSQESPTEIDYEKRRDSELLKCRKCSGLEHCQYADIGNAGFEPIWSVWSPLYPVVRECRFKKALNTELRNNRLFVSSKIPEAYKHFSLKRLYTSTPEQIIDPMLDFVIGDCKFLAISGPPSSGKTTFAAAIGNAIMRDDRSVLYLTAPELMIQLRYQDPNFAEKLATVCSVYCLIVDDIAAERQNAYTQEQLELILDSRIRNNLQTLITTSPSLQRLPYANPRLKSRLGRFREVLLPLTDRH